MPETIAETLKRASTAEPPETATHGPVDPTACECGGAGWVYTYAPSGRLLVVPCREHGTLEKLADRAGVGRGYVLWAGRRWPYTWTALRVFLQAMQRLAREERIPGLAAHIRRLAEAARQVRAAVKTAASIAWHGAGRHPGTWVLLSGGYGSGKSFLLRAAEVEAVRLGVPVRSTLMAGIVQRAMDAIGSRRANAVREALRQYTDEPVLIAVDEAEKVGSSDWRQEVLTALWGRWYDRTVGGEMVLLAATNLPREELPGYIRSRAQDARFSYAALGDFDMRPYVGHPRLREIVGELLAQKEG